MKVYAALMTGIETELKIFKTLEEAKNQIYAWFGQSMMETIIDKDRQTWDEIFDKVDIYDDKEKYKGFSIYDDTIETEYQIIEVDIPFASEAPSINFNAINEMKS